MRAGRNVGFTGPGPRSPGKARRLGILSLLGLLSLSGWACAGGGLQLAELSSEPVAIIFRTLDESERRAEILERIKAPPSRRPGEAIARLDQVQQLMGVGRSLEERRADSLGRLAFLDVTTERVTPADFALRGSRPLDWSPGHERLLYLSARDGALQVFEYIPGTREVRGITRGPADHTWACYGPDRRIAVARLQSDDGNLSSRIYITQAGGGSPRPVSPGPVDTKPAWSPDGRTLIYGTVDPDGTERLASLDPAEGGPPRILARGRDATFTPDGEWVVYSAQTRMGWKLWRMRPDGTGKLPLGRGPQDREEHDPAVSPDGRVVMYVAEENSRERLWMRPMDGSGDRPMVRNGDALAPAW